MEDNIFVTQIAPQCLKPGDARKATDVLFLVLFLINVLIWAGICDVHTPNWDDVLFYLSSKTVLIQTAICGTVAIGAIFSIAFFQTVLKCRGTVYLAILLIAIQVFSLLAFVPCQVFAILYFYMHSFFGSLAVVTLIITVVCLFYQTITLICVKEADMNVLFEFIDKSCRAASHSLIPVIFSMVTSFLALMISFFTITLSCSMIYKTSYYYFGDGIMDVLNAFPVCMLAFGGLYITNFICNFGSLVTGDYYANYYGTYDKQNISKMSIFRSITMVVRNHLGTVALLSMPLLSRICALVMSFRSNQCDEKPDNTSTNFVSKTSLIMDTTDFALVRTSMYGCNAFESTRKMFDLHQYTSTLFLTVNTVSLKFIEISTMITLTITIITAFVVRTISFHFAFKPEPSIHEVLSEDVLIMATFYTIFVHKILIRPAMSTFLIYKMISTRISDASEKMIKA